MRQIGQTRQTRHKPDINPTKVRKGCGSVMGKKCKKCKVPLEGFLCRLIAKTLFGVRPSAKDPELCNKCEDKK